MNADLCWSNEVEPVSVQEFRAWQEQSREIERRQIVFIVGPQRTGTTWLARALDAHPEVVSKHESHIASELLAPFFSAILRYNSLPPASFPHLRLTERDATRLARQVVDRLLLNYLSTSQAPERIRAIVDKSPNHCRDVGFLGALYPSSKFVLCLRDVRDAAVSMWHVDREFGLDRCKSVEEMGRWYTREVFRQGVREARASAECLGPGRFLEIWYEDHTRDPAGELERVLRFIGVDHSPATVSGVVEKSSFKAFAGRDSGVEGKGMYRKGVVGDWTNYFTPDFGDELLRLAGIASDGRSPAAQHRLSGA